jgi:hypothetical protein
MDYSVKVNEILLPKATIQRAQRPKRWMPESPIGSIPLSEQQKKTRTRRCVEFGWKIFCDSSSTMVVMTTRSDDDDDDDDDDEGEYCRKRMVEFEDETRCAPSCCYYYWYWWWFRK